MQISVQFLQNDEEIWAFKVNFFFRNLGTVVELENSLEKVVQQRLTAKKGLRRKIVPTGFGG